MKFIKSYNTFHVSNLELIENVSTKRCRQLKSTCNTDFDAIWDFNVVSRFGRSKDVLFAVLSVSEKAKIGIIL